MASEWMRQQLTLPNILLLATVATGMGGYMTSVRTLELRVTALEQSQFNASLAAVRQEETLKSISATLAEVKDDVKDIKKERSTR